jgi:hypothetical protein
MAAAQVTSPQFPGVTCEEVQVPMRDGTLLSTDVYLPSVPGRYPVVMQREPYGRAFGDGCFSGISSEVATFAQQGYVGIDQQVRGTYTSQGSFTRIFQEAKDMTLSNGPACSLGRPAGRHDQRLLSRHRAVASGTTTPAPSRRDRPEHYGFRLP